MFHATKLIYDCLNAKEDLKVFTEENDSSSRVWLQFGIENGGHYRIQYISNDNDNDVSVRIYGLIRVTEAKKAAVMMAISELNCQYRYVKFTLDSDNDVNLEYDFPLRTPDDKLGEFASEVMVRFVKIVDKAYPILMRALYV